jgi:hypothetical protein
MGDAYERQTGEGVERAVMARCKVVTPSIDLEWLRKTTKVLSHLLGLESKPETVEYEAGVITAQP